MLFRKAILVIHGFAGGTYDEEDLANYLELNREFDVFQFTLPGHEKKINKIDYQEWIICSENKIQWLIKNGYNKIYLIGHSMGGVIATYLASKYKEIRKLVLAAPAFQYLKVIKDDLNIGESLTLAPKIIKEHGTNEVISKMLKFNINVVKAFMTLVKECYEYPKYITCPTLIIQGRDDTWVPKTSSEYVYNNIKSKKKKLVFLDDVTHDVFKGQNKEKIFRLVEIFLKR